jgi:hypothetical protein
MQDQLPLLITDFGLGFDGFSSRGESMDLLLYELPSLIYERWQVEAGFDGFFDYQLWQVGLFVNIPRNTSFE